MAFASTETISNDIIDALNVLIAKSCYFDENSPELTKLMHDANKLMGVAPSAANMAKAAIYQLSANVEKVEYHIGLANKLFNENKPLLVLNSAVAFSNLGMFSKSQLYFTQLQEPNGIELSQIIDGGYGSLSISSMNQIFDKVKTMKLSYDNEIVELNTRMEAVLTASNISEKTLAKYADVFGDLLRENRLMIKTRYPTIAVGDDQSNWHPSTLFITFEIDVDAKTAAKLYKEGTKRLIKKFSKIPESLHFSVEPI